MLNKLNAIWAAILADLKDTWNRGKMLFIAVGALIIALEFQKLKEFLLVYLGQRQLKETQKTDTDLANKEKTDIEQANNLEQKAKDEFVDNDWYKKQ